jgi:hypothetical protein
LPIVAVLSPMPRFAMVRAREDTEQHRKLPNKLELHSALFGIKSDTIWSTSKMPINPSISRLLDDIPEKPPRSKLELHADVIATVRRKRRTYREIAEFFREYLAITVAPSTIHDFVRVRRRRGKRSVVFSGEQSSSEAKDVSSPPVPGISATEDDVQRRIAALKSRTPAKQPQPLFTYKEEEPLKFQRRPASDEID